MSGGGVCYTSRSAPLWGDCFEMAAGSRVLHASSIDPRFSFLRFVRPLVAVCCVCKRSLFIIAAIGRPVGFLPCASLRGTGMIRRSLFAEQNPSTEPWPIRTSGTRDSCTHLVHLRAIFEVVQFNVSPDTPSCDTMTGRPLFGIIQDLFVDRLRLTRMNEANVDDKRHDDAKSQKAGRPSAWLALVFTITIFLSAFLLFQVQPLISKAILPWFGGSPSLWTASMLFFQVALFAGYAYAHLCTKYLPPFVQGLVHVVLVVTALLLLPIAPAESWKSSDVAEPTWHVIALLGVSVGPQFFLLSTTAPLVQAWWSRVFAGSPYRLYAVSNAGSLLALVGFPFLLEPTLGVQLQMNIWSTCFGVFALLLLICGSTVWKNEPREALPKRERDSDTSASEGELRADHIGVWRRVSWVAMSAGGSVLLLATTNHLCRDVAVVPLLWVAPLSLYLLSFVICFGAAGGYRRTWCVPLMLLFTFLASVHFSNEQVFGFWPQLIIYLGALFGSCLVLHGELYQLRPGPRHLTAFYLLVSGGGAMGGIFVSLVAPRLFSGLYEFPLSMIACWLAVFAVFYFDKTARIRQRRWVWIPLLGLFGLYCIHFAWGAVVQQDHVVFARRNFYGVLTILDMRQGGQRVFHVRSGSVRHGTQFADEELRMQPTAYYGPTGGLGMVMQETNRAPSRRIGAIGLGAGTIIVYGKSADYFHFYELDPDMAQIAERRFSFLQRASTERGVEYDIVLGDARKSMEIEANDGAAASERFDILVLDAFSGDAIPVHLLTVEAFEIYLQRLHANSIVAVNISNQHLDLLPVLRGTAEHFKLDLAVVYDVPEPELQARQLAASRWALLGSAARLANLKRHPQVDAPSTTAPSVLWTDDYSNIFRLIPFFEG